MYSKSKYQEIDDIMLYAFDPKSNIVIHETYYCVEVPELKESKKSLDLDYEKIDQFDLTPKLRRNWTIKNEKRQNSFQKYQK